MAAPLSPVETSECKPAALVARSLQIDSHRGERAHAARADLVCLVASHRARLQPADRDETVTQRDADSASNVLVTGAAPPQPPRRLAPERRCRTDRQGAEPFLQACDVGAADTV